MRLQAAMLSVFFAVVLSLSGTAHAQFNEAVSAFKSALRDADRALNPRRSRRRAKHGLRATVSDDQAPPPLPVGNPQRRGGSKTQAKQRRAANSERKPSSQSKSGAGSAAKAAAPQSGSRKEKAAPAAPPPDVWSEKQIQQARKQCRAILRKVNAKFAPADPIKKGPCGDAAPYRLASIGTKHKVVFKPAPVLNCRMIQAMDVWLRKGLQPLAKRHLGGPITHISVMSSYSCRNAYGRKKTRLSEHAKANALDIGGFRTRQGVRAFLLADWGPTQRDLIARAKRDEAERIAAAMRAGAAEKRRIAIATQPSASGSEPAGSQKAGRAGKVTGSITPNRGSRVSVVTQPRTFPSRLEAANPVDTLPPPLPDRRPSLRQRLQWAKAEQARRAARRAKAQRGNFKDELNEFLYQRHDLGGPKPKKSTASGAKVKQPEKRRVNKEAFLKGAHQTACKIFGTVLGPEANDAHRDHFHVDLAERRYKNYCR